MVFEKQKERDSQVNALGINSDGGAIVWMVLLFWSVYILDLGLPF